METAAQLCGFPHAANMGTGLDPDLRKDRRQRIGRREDNIHPTHGLFWIIDTLNIDTQQLRGLVAEFFPSFGIAAGNENFFNAANGEQNFENPESVPPDAE